MIKNIFKDSLFENSIFLISTNFAGSGLGFIFWVIAARYYSSHDIGIASSIFSGLSLVSMISSIGLPVAMIYYLPRNNNTNKIINSCINAGIISSIIFSLIFLSGLKFWTPGLLGVLHSLKNNLIFVIITIAVSISMIIGSAFIAGKRSSFQMIKETSYHFIKIFPLILLRKFGAIGIFMSIGIGLILSIVIGYIILSRFWKFSPELTIDPIIKSMAGFSIGNHAATIFYNLPIFVLPIMILNMMSAKFAGYFYIAMMMASLLYGVSQSISSSLLVESSDKIEFASVTNKAIKFNLAIMTIGIIFFIIFGRFILNIFNPHYAEQATMAMIILCIASMPLSLIGIFGTVRNAQNRVVSMATMDLLVASITIILSVPLIRMMGLEGAAISFLIANTVGAFIVFIRLNDPKEFTIRLLYDIKNDVSSNIMAINGIISKKLD